jgi:DNA-binding protein HU-beta
LTPHPAFDRTRGIVNKRDLVDKIALDASLTRAQAARALDAFVQGIRMSLVSGDRVTISGFGTFGVKHRKARKVRNPRSGNSMEIGETRVPRFAPGTELKIAITENWRGPNHTGR